MYNDLLSKTNSPRDYLVSAQAHSISMQSIARELSLKYNSSNYQSLEGFTTTYISLEEEQQQETKGFIAFIKNIWKKIKEFFARIWGYIKSFFSSIFSSKKKEDKKN
jgi:hypothetical protein